MRVAAYVRVSTEEQAQRFGAKRRRRVSLLEPIQPHACAHPEAAVASSMQGGDEIIGEAVFRRVDEELSVLEPQQPVSSSDPEVSFAILQKRQDDVARQPVATGERFRSLKNVGQAREAQAAFRLWKVG